MPKSEFWLMSSPHFSNLAKNSPKPLQIVGKVAIICSILWWKIATSGHSAAEFQSIRLSFKMLQSAVGCYKVLQGAAGCFNVTYFWADTFGCVWMGKSIQCIFWEPLTSPYRMQAKPKPSTSQEKLLHLLHFGLRCTQHATLWYHDWYMVTPLLMPVQCTFEVWESLERFYRCPQN